MCKFFVSLIFIFLVFKNFKPVSLNFRSFFLQFQRLHLRKTAFKTLKKINFCCCFE